MCPKLEAADERCADILTLDLLASALECCANRYSLCPIYREILLDDRDDQPDVLAA